MADDIYLDKQLPFHHYVTLSLSLSLEGELITVTVPAYHVQLPASNLGMKRTNNAPGPGPLRGSSSPFLGL